MFSCKYCEIFKITYFEEYLRTVAFANTTSLWDQRSPYQFGLNLDTIDIFLRLPYFQYMFFIEQTHLLEIGSKFNVLLWTFCIWVQFKAYVQGVDHCHQYFYIGKYLSFFIVQLIVMLTIERADGSSLLYPSWSCKWIYLHLRQALEIIDLLELKKHNIAAIFVLRMFWSFKNS